MNKTEIKKLFKKLLANRVASYVPGAEIIELCKQSRLYSKLALTDGCKVKIGTANFGGRFNKFVCLEAPGHELRPIIQGKLIDSLFPKTRAATSSSSGKVIKAMRNLVSGQISEYRQNYRKACKIDARLLICPLSGVDMRYCKTHVDHVYPFSLLVKDWANLLRLDLAKIDLNRQGLFKDDKLAESWLEYHKSNAKLQLVSQSANCSKGAKII